MPTAALMMQMASVGLGDRAFRTFLPVPPLFVIWSKRVHSSRKFLWAVVTSLFSWLAYAAFLVTTRGAASHRGFSASAAP